MDVVGRGKSRNELARRIRFDLRKRGDFVVEGKPPDASGQDADRNKQKRHCYQIETIGAGGRHVVHRRATRIVVIGHSLSSCPGGREYVRNGSGGQRGRDQVCLDLIVRTEPKPIINQPTIQAVIAPPSVARICAVEELPCAGDCSLGGVAVTGSVGAGAMTRIWPGAGAAKRSVCTSVLVAGGASATESALLRSSVAAIVVGGVVFAVEEVGTGVVGRCTAAGSRSLSSVVNCSTVAAVARSPAAAGSAFGHATREFILSARRAGR
jgi:hypothetical protein